jgi:galactokinase
MNRTPHHLPTRPLVLPDAGNPDQAQARDRAQLRELVGLFSGMYGRPPTHAAAAPGRVNLIGEHTDYNDGFVLPLAIDRYSVFLAAERSDSRVCVQSTGVDGELVLDLNEPVSPGEPGWTNYIRGPVALAAEQGFQTKGFDALIHSTVPTGGGLSSSASLEVATLTLIESLTGKRMDPVQKALTAQRAEHEFAGVPCGIMDQYASVLGRSGHCLLIDCRDRSTRYIKLDSPSVCVLVINSKVKHSLAGGEYARRRGQCKAAAKAIGVDALRDTTPGGLEAARDRLDPTAYARARHVIMENQRTLDTADALDRKDYTEAGRLMFQSHASLRDDFEVSTPELDQLVESAHRQSQAGVIGSRMTGGGFGGCTITLVHPGEVRKIASVILNDYRDATGIEADAFVTRASAGARALSCDSLK